MLAGGNGVGTTGGGALGARTAFGNLSLGGRCSLASGSFVHFTPNAGFVETGDRLGCFVDVAPQLRVGPLRVRTTLSVGGGLDRVNGAIRPLLLTSAGAGADLPITRRLSIVGDARVENALGPKGISGGFVVGVGFAMSL